MPVLQLALEQHHTPQQHVAVFAGVLGAIYGGMVADLGLEGARAVMATLSERLVLAEPNGGLARIIN